MFYGSIVHWCTGPFSARGERKKNLMERTSNPVAVNALSTDNLFLLFSFRSVYPRQLCGPSFRFLVAVVVS